MSFFMVLSILCLIPVMGGSVYAILCLLAVFRLRFKASQPSTDGTWHEWSPVTILKPVCGLEKNLRNNLRSTCNQDYPAFQVVLSVQRPDDPAIPLLFEIQREFGRKRVTVAIEHCEAGPNGKINNLIGGLKHARHDMLVISDSDVQLRPDYLKTIIGPLANPEVGGVCTMYKAVQAQTWFEKMELLTINGELTPNMMFALVTGASRFCLGASTALRRSTLEQIGGLESLADYLVEDFEMGRRIWSSGKRMVILPYLIETIVDLRTPLQWWNHLVYWDQNQRAARPYAMFATILIKSVPFACLYALLSWGSGMGILVLSMALMIRLLTTGLILKWGLDDREGLRSLWLVPLRDLAALGSWLLAYTQRSTVWRDEKFLLTADGRLVAIEGTTCDHSSLQETTSASPYR